MMKILKMHHIAALFCLSLLFFSASSNAIVQLVPPIQEVIVQRGSKGTFTLTIKNIGDNNEPSRFSTHNLDISADGVPIIADSTDPRGCGNWITLEPQESIIKPGEALVLTGSISVPKNAEGGYYAAIKGCFTGMTIPLEGEKVNLKQSQIALESQAVVAVLITVPSSRNKAIIVPDTLLFYPKGQAVSDANFSNNGRKGWRLIMPTRNDGNVHTRISGNVSLWTESGTRIESAPFSAGRGYLFPGKVRNLYASGENVLTDGYYMIRIALMTSENRNMANSFPFAVYNGEIYPGATTDQLSDLIYSSAPGFIMKEQFMRKTVTPGGVTYMSVQIMNTRNDTLLLFPRKMEWRLNEAGLPDMGSDGFFQPRSCTSWISFLEAQINLPPGRSSSFKLKLNPPSQVIGEYYAAIVFDPDRPRPDLPPEFMAARTQLLALSSPKDLNYSIEVDSITMKKESNKELTLFRFYFNVKNTGNAHCFAKGNISLEKQYAEGVYKPVGKIMDFGDTQAFLLPGDKRKFEVDIPDIEKGKYRIILATNYQEETQPVVRYQRIEIK